MSNLVLTFTGHIPSKKNSRRSFGRVNLPSKAYEKWHKRELATLINAPAIPSPVEITYAFYIGGKVSPMEFDLSNSEESINDLLVDAGIIEDDSWLHVVDRRGYVAGFIQGEGRCVVDITHVPGVAWRDPVLLLKNDAEIRRLKELTGQPLAKIRANEWQKLTSDAA